jgi:hypothetical protein
MFCLITSELAAEFAVAEWKTVAIVSENSNLRLDPFILRLERLQLAKLTPDDFTHFPVAFFSAVSSGGYGANAQGDSFSRKNQSGFDNEFSSSGGY